MGASSCGSGVSRERNPTEELAPMGRSYKVDCPARIPSALLHP